ncbi:hypothetical protein SGCOL_006465 [Colletotrichum sp. CLE4]
MSTSTSSREDAILPNVRYVHVSTKNLDTCTPPETCHLISQSGIAKAKLSWPDLILKFFFGGIFISLGSLFNLAIAGGAPGLRASNPALATMLSALTFPIGFVLTVFTNTELVTSNMAVVMYSTLQHKTCWYDLGKNWVVSYVFNLAGCLFFAGVLAWWTDTLESDAQTDVCLGYQHSIANFFLVPTGMFYGTDFGVGKFIYQSVIPVTLGNIVGGAVMAGGVLWFLYGRDDGLVDKNNRLHNRELKTVPEAGIMDPHQVIDGRDSEESVAAENTSGVRQRRGADMV